MLALYVHVPVCASKCSYCDFYSLPRGFLPENYEDDLVEATLGRAASLVKRFVARGAIETIYIGGGTPTMLSLPALGRLLSGLSNLACENGGTEPREWSVEANPDSLSPEALDLMREKGVTRISIGVQSLDAAELKLLGRIHGPEEALAALSLAASRGFAVSADLMAALPRPRAGSRGVTRNLGGLARYAKEIVEAGASHISAYDLCLEEGTPLDAMKGELSFPSEDETWEERDLLESALRKMGFRRYEVSNYAPPGRECLHNLAYWRMDSYIGAGPGAVSTIAMDGGSSLRIEEAKDILSYRACLPSRAVETKIGFRDTVFETVMMAFRTSFGLDLDSFESRYNLSAEKLLEGSLAAWKGHIVHGEAPTACPATPRALALDGAGLDILNRFLCDCLEEIEEKLEP
jgi:oxygen-independent coproporphyrinogen-3 oxidase